MFNHSFAPPPYRRSLGRQMVDLFGLLPDAIAAFLVVLGVIAVYLTVGVSG